MSGLSAHATTLAATQSPLDKLVRQQSKRARGSPYASPPQVVVSQPSSSQAFGYGPHASYQSASSTLDSPASSQTPHSPLLHTRFGNTQRYSDLSETSSYAPSDDIDGDGHRPFSHLTAVGPAARSGLESASPDGGPPSPTPSSPGAALGVPLPPPARHSDVDPFAFRSYESQPPSGRVPIVAAARSDEGHGQRQSQHRVASQLSVSSAEAVQPRLNFSRPLKRQPAEQPPPPPVPAPSQPPAQQQHNPYMRPPQPEPDSSPQSSFSFPPTQQPQQQQQSFQFPPAKQQPFQFPPKQPPAPAFQSQSHSHIRSPSVRDDGDDDDDDEAGLAYASPDPGQELFGGGQAKGSRDRHPYAYVSGAPSNYEYDEGASPVEISPLTPTPHQYAADTQTQQQQHTPWAISPERRRTLPPGFDMRAAAGAATGELSPISDESETAMREHAAAFTLDPRERWEEEASPLPEGSYDDPGPVRFADSPRMAPRALYDEPRSPPQQQRAPPPQPQFAQPRYNDMQQRFEDPRAAPHPHAHAQHRYTESSSTIRGGEDPSAPQQHPRTEAQRYRDELQMREREREQYDQPQAQGQRPYSPQQRGYDPQMAYRDQRPYDAQAPNQHPQSLYPGQQGQRPRNDSSPRQPPQHMLYRDEQQRPYGSPREQPGQMYQDGPQRAFDSPQAYAGSPQGGPRPYTPQQQGYSNMNSPGPQSALSPQSANSQRPHSPYSPNMQQQQQQPRSRSPIPPRGPSPHPPPVYPLPMPGEIYPDSHTQPQQPPASVQSPSQAQQAPLQQQLQFAQQHPQIPPPPPEPADAPAMSRADKGISYYSTQSQYFPPPSARPAQHVQLPAAPPSPNFGRPGSRNSVYSNYSYYAIPSPTGSGSGTPTEERFGAHLAPTASGRETPMQMQMGQQRSGSPQAQGKKQGPVAYDAYGRPMQGPGQASGSGSSGERGFAYQQQQQARPPPQGQHGREVSEAPTLRAARDVLGRTSEETIREHPEKRGWFGRRERRPSHESSGRRSPTGSAHSHRQYVATLPNPSPGTLRADSAQEYLTLGIAAHEALRLAESAYCFEQAATFRGGCAVGMLMWGLALRHAWGVRKDEKEGFKWLRRAAGRAVEGLEMAYSGKDSKEGKGELEGVKTELVLAIYEVGQCFFHGWGVVTDKKMAVSYYQVAARLGDADAQQALAFCYANGRGTKKDLKESAKWYRAAAAQGASTVGLAWIYKTKYGAEEDADGRPAQR